MICERSRRFLGICVNFQGSGKRIRQSSQKGFRVLVFGKTVFIIQTPAQIVDDDSDTNKNGTAPGAPKRLSARLQSTRARVSRCSRLPNALHATHVGGCFAPSKCSCKGIFTRFAGPLPGQMPETKTAPLRVPFCFERETGIEPATPTLARWCSTAEPLARAVLSNASKNIHQNDLYVNPVFCFFGLLFIRPFPSDPSASAG